ncbi:hypothetical protein [Ureibacillus manganicus]|uniref:Uncharacterized protein n=1 Tax=Ureibacillus manganicus DSM 26584 TaxID=1384049 RepID=A0A0A3HZP6_9BACL|nr:hypothetical protein [Ureibacillus manganicus]KGR77909.1 hypothetical protein CD29_13550 [Ureibacillus manganicus DSM 26584]
MEFIRELISMIPVLFIFSLPVLIPLLLKKWKWFFTVSIGCLLYILWGVFLHFTADPTEYGTAYGIFILPYLILISVIGAFVQKRG